MSINSAYASAGQEAAIVTFRGKLAALRAIASLVASGAPATFATIRLQINELDSLYDDLAVLWSDLSSVASAAEATALLDVKRSLDDLFIAFREAMEGLSLSQIINFGAAYDPGSATRAEKLAALNRSMPYRSVGLPASIVTAGGDLVDAVDVFTAA